MNTLTFRSPYSKFMLVTTIIGMVLMHGAFMACMGGMVRSDLGSGRFFTYLLIFAACVFVVLYAFCLQIRKVTVDDSALVIHRQIGKVRIPLNSITKVETKDEIGLDLRLWGISFFFGHYGLFYNRSLGRYRAYVKNGDQMVVVHTPNRVHVFSCERRDELIAMLNERK
ncbi:PH domain-containing protein [Prevotella sp. oral taxon 317]|jgi:hypothetical protein|uniref:PH domain-containing protein n=1 Tax=Prevotella sp. oral taxon 317 TaxID=652721 RepID=UPI0001C3FB63|nr:PH domain-containing protein [Prevotella sp. oral taxon 317]EFC69058.1 hypothetical protein HMPREF0670_00381 [Prevotella sp. oral taxon 317 str. F0108]